MVHEYEITYCEHQSDDRKKVEVKIIGTKLIFFSTPLLVQCNYNDPGHLKIDSLFNEAKEIVGYQMSLIIQGIDKQCTLKVKDSIPFGRTVSCRDKYVYQYD